MQFNIIAIYLPVLFRYFTSFPSNVKYRNLIFVNRPTSVPEPAPIPKPVNIEPIKTPEPQAAQKTERIEEKSDSKSEFEEAALMYTSRPNFNAPISPRSQYEGTDNIVTAVSSYLGTSLNQYFKFLKYLIGIYKRVLGINITIAIVQP